MVYLSTYLVYCVFSNFGVLIMYFQDITEGYFVQSLSGKFKNEDLCMH